MHHFMNLWKKWSYVTCEIQDARQRNPSENLRCGGKDTEVGISITDNRLLLGCMCKHIVSWQIKWASESVNTVFSDHNAKIALAAQKIHNFSDSEMTWTHPVMRKWGHWPAVHHSIIQ